MVELIKLGDAHKHAAAGSASASIAAASTRNFAAAIQHITSAKRMLIDRNAARYNGAPSRVATYHVLHLADASKSYFKLLCWGDTLPTLTREGLEGEDPALCVGDVVLFSSCVIKSFRGNVEAQYTRHSTVQLLYRRGRYISTRDVKLKDFYPMLEWYKAHRQQIMFHFHASASSESHDGDSRPFSTIRDLRAEVLVNLRCTVTRRADADQVPLNGLPNSSDYDGVQLCEVTVTDENNDTMVLNLWDQYSDPNFVARLVSHQGKVQVLGVIVSHNPTLNSLLANTTPRTEFQFIEEPPTEENGVCFPETTHNEKPTQRFTTLAELESASLQGDRVVLESVAIERVQLQSFVGKSNKVEPPFTPLLAECYCSVCDQTLPLVKVNTVPQLYGACKNRCRAKSGSSECEWRYRVMHFVLRDAGVGRLTVQVGNAVLTRLLGNIHAKLLIHPQPPGEGVLSFNPHTMVATLLNALVDNGSVARDGAQLTYRVELEKVGKAGDRRASLAFTDSLEMVSQDQEREQFAVVELTPIVECLW